MTEKKDVCKHRSVKATWGKSCAVCADCGADIPNVRVTGSEQLVLKQSEIPISVAVMDVSAEQQMKAAQQSLAAEIAEVDALKDKRYYDCCAKVVFMGKHFGIRTYLSLKEGWYVRPEGLEILDNLPEEKKQALKTLGLWPLEESESA